jgi:hypothetical protein
LVIFVRCKVFFPGCIILKKKTKELSVSTKKKLAVYKKKTHPRWRRRRSPTRRTMISTPQHTSTATPSPVAGVGSVEQVMETGESSPRFHCNSYSTPKQQCVVPLLPVTPIKSQRANMGQGVLQPTQLFLSE